MGQTEAQLNSMPVQICNTGLESYKNNNKKFF